MKHLFFSTFLGLILFCATQFARSQSLSYQNIAMNAAGQHLVNQPISLRLSILVGSASGTVAYVETQATTTNATGAYSVQVGSGTTVSGTYASINWMANAHFLKAEMDPNAGTNYSIVSVGPIAANANTWQCGSSLTVNHVAGAVAPVNKTVTYGTVTNILSETSKCWITSNLGADHQATTVNDATEASAGWYWQFNHKQGYKHDGTTVTPSWTLTSIYEDSDWIAANDPCTIELGRSWRLPTKTEWYNVDVAGSWVSLSGPWNSGLKLHPEGFLQNSDGSLNDRGSYGYYWSNTQTSTFDGAYLTFSIGYCFTYDNYKTYGFGVRCIKD